MTLALGLPARATTAAPPKLSLCRLQALLRQLTLGATGQWTSSADHLRLLLPVPVPPLSSPRLTSQRQLPMVHWPQGGTGKIAMGTPKISLKGAEVTTSTMGNTNISLKEAEETTPTMGTTKTSPEGVGRRVPTKIDGL